MSFINKNDIKKSQQSVNKLLDFVVPAVSGVAGFISKDWLGLSPFIGSVIGEIENVMPILGRFDLSMLLASGLYIGLGLGISSIRFSGYLDLIPKAVGWYAIGAGAGTLLSAVTNITASATTVGG